MTILYFAWLRSKIGIGEEHLDLSETIATVADLIADLKTRGAGYAEAFADMSLIRVAVNQDYVGLDHPLKSGDEVAFFPPVTGG